LIAHSTPGNPFQNPHLARTVSEMSTSEDHSPAGSDKRRFAELAADLARRYSRLPSVTGFAIGGSFARGLLDEHSDLEAYCYHDGELPDKVAIQEILDDLNANTVRSPDLHWRHISWGVHSFFQAHGITVELGYRDINETARKLDSYLFEGQFETTIGDHDVPFGHYPSGLAACLTDCQILTDKSNAVANLKLQASQFPSILREALLNFHLLEARGILENKLSTAHRRSDLLHFNAGLARALRSIVIAVFTANRRHFPGDKWNIEYLKDATIIPRGFFQDCQELLDTRLTYRQERDRALEIIRSWADWIEATQ